MVNISRQAINLYTSNNQWGNATTKITETGVEIKESFFDIEFPIAMSKCFTVLPVAYDMNPGRGEAVHMTSISGTGARLCASSNYNNNIRIDYLAMGIN